MMMFSVEFILASGVPRSEGGLLSDYERGHMVFRSHKNRVSSENKSPDQSMMIFPSCGELLDDVRQVMQLRVGSREWIGVGCSFNLKIFKKEEFVRLSSCGVDLGAIEAAIIVRAIHDSSSLLLNIARSALPVGSVALSDIEGAFRDFKPLLKNAF